MIKPKRSVAKVMEGLCYRFPVLGELVLNNLDKQSLSNCQESSRVISQFLIKERFFWIRIIQKYFENLSEFKRLWEMVISRTSADTLKVRDQAVLQLHGTNSPGVIGSKKCENFKSQSFLITMAIKHWY